MLANSTSYGIFAEMNRQDDEEGRVDVYGLGLFETEVTDPEAPGECSFPPLAAFMAGAARLMLALLERSVTDLGGTFAMCNTDSMAIVATESGEVVPCPGGHERRNGKVAIRALSWDQVEGIRQRFARLNLYDPVKIPGSVLRVEDVNVGTDWEQRKLWCYAISAKRYCLYTLDDHGEPQLVKWSEHGLGHLLNPTNPESGDRDWMRQLWEGIVREELGLDPRWPAWLDRPALSRLTISSPTLLAPFAALNGGRPYPDQIEPFNFLLTAHVARFGHPDDVDPTRFQLVAPYETDARAWPRLEWIDRSSGARYHISTTADTGGAVVARVQTYRDVLENFRHHPDVKSAGPDGQPCGRQSVGLLRRRVVRSIPELTTHVGKEANRLEAVEAGIEHHRDGVWTEYRDPGLDPWMKLVLPVFKQMPIDRLVVVTGMHRRSLFAIRAGERLPHPKNRQALVAAAGAFASERLRDSALGPSLDDLAACAAFVERSR